MSLPTFSDIKNWSVEIEKKITDEWKQSTQWKFNPETKKKVYSIDTPPPYVNTPIHMGHAVTYVYMDAFARYQRMKGREVLFPLGLDRNGLPIEIATEKKFDVSPFHIGRAKFLELCEKLLAEASSASTDSFAQLGISFNSYKKGNTLGDMYHTDDAAYRALTQATFIGLFKKNLVYEDVRINNWDPRLRTTIADSEIEYKEVPSTFNHITWTVKETGEKITIATTRPELLCSCAMVIYNPDDERYQHLEGKTAIVPLYGLEVPIHEHPLAKVDKGSGLVMMCSAGDVTDIQFFREMRLTPKIAIEKDGTMNHHAGFLKGLTIKEARHKIIQELQEKNLLKKQEQITHRTPVSERSGAHVEFIEMPEFYLKQREFKDELITLAEKMNFYPESSQELLEQWIEDIAIDWPISRRRFYATPIPLWSADKGYIAVPPEGAYYQPWKESPPEDALVYENGKSTGKKVKQMKGVQWKGEERVFDTWFDSSISALWLTHYKSNNALFKKTYPVSLRPQGKEIIRTWLYYSTLRCYLETSKAPFKDVWIHQHITDAQGRKMSKSLGNVVDPQEILASEGAEALRLWSFIEGDIAKGDLLCSRERIKAETKTINKLLNAARFIMQFKKPAKATLTKLDSLMIAYTDNLTKDAEECYAKYDFHTPAIKIREFLWDTFTSHYVELVKARAYNENALFTKEENASALYALHTILERIIQLLYPMIPQVTTILAKELSLQLNTFPKTGTKKDTSDIQDIIAFNSLVWKQKKERNISLREQITGIAIPEQLKKFDKDLIACHRLTYDRT